MSQPTTLTHPITGLPVVPLGRRKNGRLIWPIMGGSEAAGGGDGGDGSSGSGGEGGQGGGEGSAGGNDPKGGDNGNGSGDDLLSLIRNNPEKAKSEIERLRQENASARTSAKEQAAEEARKSVLEDIAKSLGLKDGEKAPTVEELTQKLTEQTAKTEQASAAHRDTQAELVVWRNAKSLNVDAAALTDSRAFATAIADLDSSSKTFEEDVKKAAQEAVNKNPKLAAAPAAGSSSADHGGTGGGAPKTPKSLDAAIGGHYGT